MKKIMIAAQSFVMSVAVFIALSQTAVFAAETQNLTSTMIRSHSFQPCNIWYYNYSPNGMSGYVCGSPSMSVQVPDAYSTEDAIRRLEDRIQTLEQRIQALEQRQ